MKELCAAGLPAGQAITALAALDGLYFWHLLGRVAVPPPRWRAVRRAVEALTRLPEK
jgi:hypothetical protein